MHCQSAPSTRRRAMTLQGSIWSGCTQRYTDGPLPIQQVERRHHQPTLGHGEASGCENGTSGNPSSDVGPMGQGHHKTSCVICPQLRAHVATACLLNTCLCEVPPCVLIAGLPFRAVLAAAHAIIMRHTSTFEA
jgi:hypothetical protein